MAQFSGQWPSGSLNNMHSSNPEPLSLTELSEITQIDVIEHLHCAPLAYETTQGNPNLRAQISALMHTEVSSQNIVLTSGAQEGIFLVMNALLSPGDQVISFSPCFEPLVTEAKNVGADVTVLPLDEQNGWQIKWNELEAIISEKTSMLVINFPHNPTGTHINKKELNRLVELCIQNDCWLLSDEVFRGLEHDESSHLPSAVDLYDKAVVMGVMSKALALPGIRLGWVVSTNAALTERIMVIKSHLSICQSSLDAHICQAIIPVSEKIWQRNISTINQNKSYINLALNGHPSMSWQQPKASATGFIQLKNNTGSEFTTNLANTKGILLLPNQVFLSEHQGFRVTLGKKDSNSLIDQIINFDR